MIHAPPGTGKAVAIAALLGRLDSNLRGRGRYLVVAPAAYVERWRIVVGRWSGIPAYVVDARTYLRPQGAGAGPLRAPGCYVVSIDFVKRTPYREELGAVPWDALVLDEVEALRDSTVRANASESLWRSEQIPLGLASAAATPPGWLRSGAKLHQTSWRAVATAYRATVAQPEMVPFTFSPPERKFFDAVVRLLDHFSTEKSHGTVFGPVVREMAASSVHAIELFLRTTLDDTRRALDRWTPEAVSTAEASTADIAAVRRKCARALELLETVQIDSKWEACLVILEKAMTASAGSPVIYTEFEATARYLATLCEGRGWPVRLLSAEDTFEDFEAFDLDPGPTVVVLPAPFTNVIDAELTWGVIHFDLPSEAAGLLRRLPVVQAGSIRVGQFVLADDLFTTPERVRKAWAVAGKSDPRTDDRAHSFATEVAAGAAHRKSTKQGDGK